MRNDTPAKLIKEFLCVMIPACLISAWATSCSTAPAQQLETNKNYRMDLDMEVNGVRRVGTVVVPKADVYHIHVRTDPAPEIVTINSCSREVTLLKQNKDFTYDYTPNDVEASGYCLIRIQASAQKKWYTAGAIDIVDPTVTEYARLFCNGGSEVTTGVGMCQSRAGLYQKVRFLAPMVAGNPKECDQPTSTDGFEWTFKTPKGSCPVKFWTKAAPFKYYRLDVFGYDEFTFN